MYTVSVDLDRGTGTDVSAVASTTVHVQNPVGFGAARVANDGSSVTATHATLDEYEEDVASGDITVMFMPNPYDGALSVDDNDTITIQLQNFQIPAGLSASEISIMDNTNTGGEAPAGVSVSGDTVMLMVPDMDSDQLLTQTINAIEAAMVTVTFKAAAGIMNPTNGGGHSVMVHTSASSKPAEQMICMDEVGPMATPARHLYTPINTAGGCDAAAADPAPVMVEVMPTTPDISRVNVANDVSGGYTGSMTTRFVTDADLTMQDTITLKLGGMMDGEYRGFMLPQADFFPPKSVLVNGHEVASPDVDSDAGVVKLRIPSNADILAGDSVSVTFLEETGIMNPTLAADVPMMDYAVMVKTSAENDEYGSSAVTIVMAEDVMMAPGDGIVMVEAEPNTEGSQTRLTVRFMTGDNGALIENDEITIVAPGFLTSASVGREDVTINGAMPKSVAVSGDEVILTLSAGIPKNRTVQVIFKASAGLINPKSGTVSVSVSTSKEGAEAMGDVKIAPAPKPEELEAIRVVPQVPGAESTITLKFMTKEELNSISNSEIIFRFHDNFNVTGGRVDVSKVTIQADRIFGGPLVDTPKASRVVNPTSATVSYETVDRNPQVRLAVPDMADDEGNQHILPGATVTVIFQQGSGIVNPSEAGEYFVSQAIDDDSELTKLGDGNNFVLPVVVSLSGDGGKRGTSVTAVAKGVEGNEAVTFWLDKANVKVPNKKAPGNGPDGIFQAAETVLCRATAEANDTATCVFKVANPPFTPGDQLWVNVQDSEGRRIGMTKGNAVAPSVGYDWPVLVKAIGAFEQHPIHAAEVKLDAKVSISPSEVNLGDTVTVTMQDYATSGVDEIKIGSVATGPDRPAVGSQATRAAGSRRIQLHLRNTSPGERNANTPGQGASGRQFPQERYG